MLKVILTGATGMVGEGVLLTALANPNVESVLVIGRRSCGIHNPKLRELIHSDFMDITPAADQMAGYDSCFFCAGVSSVGKNENEYSRLTHDLTTHFAEVFKAQNPGVTTSFCYVSGYGTDSTERGRQMWARVKGRTENRLIQVFGRNAFMFRPGYMKPVKGQRHVLKFYFGWQVLYPVMKLLMPKFTCTLEQVSQAMVNCSRGKFSKNILEVRDITAASEVK